MDYITRLIITPCKVMLLTTFLHFPLAGWHESVTNQTHGAEESQMNGVRDGPFVRGSFPLLS
jgi:hypothetical protein